MFNNLNNIKNNLKISNAEFYQVEFSKKQIEDGIRFETTEKFINFLNNQKVNTVFYNEYFDNVENYLITQDLIEDVLGKYNAKELIEIIGKDVEQYNRQILNINFKEPVTIIVGAFLYSNFFYVLIENEEDKININNPIEKLDDILSNNEINIIKKKEEKKQLLENLKQELCIIIRNDEKFLLCTNKHLRVTYIKDLLLKQISDKFEPLKEYWLADTPRGIYQEAIDFIEILWKEMKQKSR